MRFNPYLYDVFISHAVEDKIAIATDLTERLEKAGLSVWYSGNELNAGDDLGQTIDHGLDQSRFGIAIITPTYLRKSYTRKEYYHLLAREKDGVGVILTVIHDITAAEIIAVDPDMARKFLIDSRRGMDYVVNELLKVILPERCKRRRQARIFQALFASIVALLIFFLGYAAFWYHNHRPTQEIVEQAINSRVASLQRAVEDKYLAEIRSAGGAIAQPATLDSIQIEYSGLTNRFRNEYEFSNEIISVSSRRRVWDTLKIDPETLALAPQCGFADADIYFRSTGFTPPAEAGFGLVNKRNVSYDYQLSSGSLANEYTVTVKYTNPIRFVYLQLFFPLQEGTRRRNFTIRGLLPVERYEFVQLTEGDWVLSRVF